MPEALVQDASISQATQCARCHGPQADLVLRTERLCQYVALRLSTTYATRLNQSLGSVTPSTLQPKS